MSSKCFIDLFDSTSFRGARRRIYGPARFEGHLLGLDEHSPCSVRVGEEAALRIESSTGKETSLSGGDAVDSLEAGRIRWLEVRAKAS